VQSATLRALAEVGTYPDDAGNVRLYHSTSAAAASSIIDEMRLVPREPSDVAQRMLLRGRGYVYLSSSPTISQDLPHGEVVLAVDVAVALLPEAPLREQFGEPPRVELELEVPMSSSVPLVFADRLDRKVDLTDLDPAVRAAIELFANSPFGQQLRDPDQDTGGWCQEASLRFLAALRDKGSNGRLLSWGSPGDNWWHCTTQLEDSDVIIDWTARQFEADAPCPRIEPRAAAEARWNLPGELDIDTAFGRGVANLPELPAWSDAQKQFFLPPPAPASEPS
jgi:hypothetical protein